MAYATVPEFVEAVTEVEAVALARAASPSTGYDDARILTALDDASAELDTYFAAKYSTPLNPVPRTVQVATIILAREALDRQGRDQVKAAAARIRQWARDVARGLAILGGGEPGVDLPAEPPAGGVQAAGPARIFDEAGLAGFLGRC